MGLKGASSLFYNKDGEITTRFGDTTIEVNPQLMKWYSIVNIHSPMARIWKSFFEFVYGSWSHDMDLSSIYDKKILNAFSKVLPTV